MNNAVIFTFRVEEAEAERGFSQEWEGRGDGAVCRLQLFGRGGETVTLVLTQGQMESLLQNLQRGKAVRTQGYQLRLGLDELIVRERVDGDTLLRIPRRLVKWLGHLPPRPSTVLRDTRPLPEITPPAGESGASPTRRRVEAPVVVLRRAPSQRVVRVEDEPGPMEG